MSLFNRYNAKNAAEDAAKPKLFFIEYNPNGYKLKPEFEDYLSKLTETDFIRFQRMFEFMLKRFPINNYPNVQTDIRDGEEVVWFGGFAALL
ncbi:MAG: hypothetical protein EOO88_40980 [Pedobacter sp.]|nr:MAG: hypothetical protein EOO88_40980 [Pedobacter sp.]